MTFSQMKNDDEVKTECFNVKVKSHEYFDLMSLGEMKPQKANKLMLSQSVTILRFETFPTNDCNPVVFSLLIYPVLFLQGLWKFEQL